MKLTIPQWLMPENWKDTLHYFVLYGAIAITWTPLMDFFTKGTSITAMFWQYTPYGGLISTLVISFGIFYILDKILHKVLKV